MACLATESNSFSPMPTSWSGYEEAGIHYGDATQNDPIGFNIGLHEWRRGAEKAGDEVVESVSAIAQPAGPTVREVYETLRERILSDLEAALPVDIVLLKMHGAMIADGYVDCEGDLIERIRRLVGPDAIIGGELDPNAHLTDQMMAHADLIVLYKEYPHTDIAVRARDLFYLAKDTAAGLIHPVMKAVDSRMIGLLHTPVEPMRSTPQTRAGSGAGNQDQCCLPV